jgi:hypothetical protein
LKTKDCDNTENWGGGLFCQAYKMELMMELMLEQGKEEDSLKLLVWVT